MADMADGGAASMLSTGSLGNGLCNCPCHAVDSGVCFCWSCYTVICKTIRKAADEIGIEPTALIAPFKDTGAAFEFGR